MGKRIKKLKKIRLHREGTNTLLYGAIAIVLVALLLWYGFETKIPFWIFAVVFGVVYGIVRIQKNSWLLLPTVRLWSSRKWKKTNISTTND